MALDLRSADVSSLFKHVRLLAMDVDGVLTDGTLGFNEEGGETKNFHVSDGLGLTALRIAGIQIAWISGRRSRAVAKRAAELQIGEIVQGVRDKGSTIREIAKRLSIERSSIAYIGDDWNDLLAFEVVGLRIAVRNSAIELKQAADYVTERAGGHGAVREVCDRLLASQDSTQKILEDYLILLKESNPDGSSGQ